MATYIHEFEAFFAQLQQIDNDTPLPEDYKASLLLASLGNSSSSNITKMALMTVYTNLLLISTPHLKLYLNQI